MWNSVNEILDISELFNIMEMADVNTQQPMVRIYNTGHDILRLFYVLPNFPFTTSEMKK